MNQVLQKIKEEKTPRCKYCGKKMIYNELSREYECTNLKCIVKRLPSDVLKDIGNFLYGENSIPEMICTPPHQYLFRDIEIIIKESIKKIIK